MILLFTGAAPRAGRPLEIPGGLIERAYQASPWAGKPITLVMEGGAAGVDFAARQWAMDRGVQPMTLFALWPTYGKRAGMLRNESMADLLVLFRSLGLDVGCIAIPGPRSVGTWGMVRTCEANAIPVHVCNLLRGAR